AKYIGIGRGIPLSNTNQLWGLAWGVLVFGELRTLNSSGRWMIIAGSLVMIAGAIALSSAVAPDAERAAWRDAVARECHRYDLDFKEADAAQQGVDAMAERAGGWSVWDILILVAAVAIFAALAHGAALPPIFIRAHWMIGLLAAMLALLLICGGLLWKWTRFS
ncbi:MAG TPA: EamA/RhaT family transporter, partial [Terriglobia bacterium]|nr:EamA/RhaT family transporter [Terriglobia bacterium]